MNPFLINSPTCISFSGGRTSAYMLWRVLDANDGLPDDAVVCFANTGKEEEATLDFVRECGLRWNVPIVWVEYRNDEAGYAIVNHKTASRNGEPFEAIIRKRNYLPNPVTRFCTVELKIRAMHKHLKTLGWYEDGWEQMVGIRHDEQRRVAKIRARPSPETVKETMILPLDDARVTLREIEAFWATQPFRLELPTVNGRTLSGNCDLCFLKGAGQIYSLIAERPERADWWARMEAIVLPNKPDGARFMKDRPSYAAMKKNIREQSVLFDFSEDHAIPCFCGD